MATMSPSLLESAIYQNLCHVVNEIHQIDLIDNTKVQNSRFKVFPLFGLFTTEKYENNGIWNWTYSFFSQRLSLNHSHVGNLIKLPIQIVNLIDSDFLSDCSNFASISRSGHLSTIMDNLVPSTNEQVLQYENAMRLSIEKLKNLASTLLPLEESIKSLTAEIEVLEMPTLHEKKVDHSSLLDM